MDVVEEAEWFEYFRIQAEQRAADRAEAKAEAQRR